MPATHYDSHDSGTDYDNSNVATKITPYTTFEGTVDRVWGSSSEFGESLGTTWQDVEIIDGALYADPEKGKFKLFSWKRAADLSPAERWERDETPTADDADGVITKTYFGDTKTYELIGARVPELTEDGEVVVEASSKVRDYEFTDDGGIDFGDFENLDGDTIAVDTEILVWQNANQDNGPSVTNRTIAETLTEYGEDATTSDDDAFDWLADTSGDNILREDLEDRRLRFFVVQRDGDQFQYNLPIIEDVATGERVMPNNRDGSASQSDSGNSDSGESRATETPDTFEEPLADFISSAKNDLELSPERAETLLQEMISDDDSAITAAMVDDHGGADAIVQEIA